LHAEEKKLYIRQWKSSPPYAPTTTIEIGRVIQAVEDMGKLDNTLIIYINGDNGTSAEGGPLGTPNEVAFFNGVAVPVDVQMKFYDVWARSRPTTTCRRAGPGPLTLPLPGSAKRLEARRHPAKHGDLLAGAHQGQGRPARAILPRHRCRATILEVSGIPAPNTWTASSRSPIEGTSFAYTFDAGNSREPSRHKTQYFEMFGQWALYHEGWLLSTQVNRAPWEVMGGRQSRPAQQPGP